MARHVPGYIAEGKFASMVGLTIWGVRAWRRRGYGPKSRKIGREVFYAEADVLAFLDPVSGE